MPQNCISARVWTCSSTVLKVTRLFRKSIKSIYALLVTSWLTQCTSYYERSPRPANPILRPAYQGSNPIADVFSLWALRQTVEMLPRVAKDQSDHEAMNQMLYEYLCTPSYHVC